MMSVQAEIGMLIALLVGAFCMGWTCCVMWYGGNDGI